MSGISGGGGGSSIPTPVSVPNGGTGKASNTQYLIPVASSTTSYGEIAIGNAGDLLTSNGAGQAPTYQAGGVIPAVQLLDDNVALLQFRMSSEHDLTVQKMEDGIVDEYEDETGVDTAKNIDATYNSAGAFYQPTQPNAPDILMHFDGVNGTTAWIDATGNHSGFITSGNTVIDTSRKKFGTASVKFDGTGDSIWLTSANAGELFSPGGDVSYDMWINYNVTPVWPHFCGRGATNYGGVGEMGFSWYNSPAAYAAYFYNIENFVSAVPSTATWYHLQVVRSSGLVQIWLQGNTLSATGLVNTDSMYSTLPVGWGSQQDGSDGFNGWMDEFRYQNDYVAYPDFTSDFAVPTEAYTLTARTMTLVGSNFTSEDAPSTGRLVIFEEDVDNVVFANTDFTAFISRDSGATFDTVTLVDQGLYSGTSNHILSGDATMTGAAASTSMTYKFVTVNTKNMKIHGAALSWK